MTLQLRIELSFVVPSVENSCILGGEYLMVEASLFLAYSLIPGLKVLYVADATNGAARWNDGIESTMTALKERYRELRAGLRNHLDDVPV